MEKVFLILVFLFFSELTVWGQAKLSGVVHDATTKLPIPYANVYFAFTSVGGVTAEDGKFNFTAIENDSYNLTVSCVGYKTIQTLVHVIPDSIYLFDFRMEQKVNELASITVWADTVNHKKDFREFKRFFLGETPNAHYCKIKNPKDIFVHLDEFNKLRAFARAPIIVENLALGYLIHYDLERFEVNIKTEGYEITGTPRFEELKPVSNSQYNKWLKGRAKSYLGSKTHFMQSVMANDLQSQGWEVVILYPEKRPKDKYLDEQIFRMKQLGKSDSLKFFQNLKALQPNSQIVSPLLSGKELLAPDDNHKMVFLGALWVRYKNELDYRFSTTRKSQGSEVTFLKKLTLYDNGYYEPQDEVRIRDYFAWIAHLGEFLPYDYRPAIDHQKK